MKLKCFKSFVFLLAALVVSCVPVKQVNYFNDLENIEDSDFNPRVKKTIMPFDKLFIKVLSTDPQTSLIFNSAEEMRFGNGNNGVIGYLVDEAGIIDFPFVGSIHVATLTTTQAAAVIQKALNHYVDNTSVSVKYIDNMVTVIGEVQNQGVHTFTQDKLNIYQAIGLGGGITKYGDRKKVILIRNEGDKITHQRLNLSDSKIAGKDSYYILPNDVIVVEPLKAVSTSYANITFTTTLTAITTLIAILIFAGLGY
jgi:polysaccharide export outer membrane protein